MTQPFDRRRGSEVSTLYIFGAGGSGREVAWLARECWGPELRVVHLVDLPEFLSPPVNGNPVQLLRDVTPLAGDRFVAALGDAAQRREAVTACEGVGLLPAAVVHPRAALSPLVDVSDGVVIYPGTIVTTNVELGRHVHLNIGCTISHDVIIGEFATLSPGVHVAGHVHIGRGVFVGTGASIINGSARAPLTIGDGAVIGAGACVLGSVAAEALVVGVPASRKR